MEAESRTDYPVQVLLRVLKVVSLWGSGTMLCTRALAWKPLLEGPLTTVPILMEHATAGESAATTTEITMKANGEQGCAMAVACRNAQTTRPM